jgi:uncharacterized membrane protein
MNYVSAKDFANKVLTGMSIGIVVALIPGALLGELAKAFDWPVVLMLGTIAQRLLAPAMGLCIAMQFRLTPVHATTLTITTMIASGAIKVVAGAAPGPATFALVGIGDVINAGLIAALTVWVLDFIGMRLKAYTILIVPMVAIALGALGLFTLPYVAAITGYVGQMVAAFTTLQPVLMGILIALTFAVLIISPISTAGVALAIGLAGIGSGAANLGVCAAGFGLAIAGFTVNGFGTSIAHFLGSPKLQMANFLTKPRMILPILVNAAICGAVGAIAGVAGTPASAGFGISGLIGPLAYLNSAGVGMSGTSIAMAAALFAGMPIVLGLVTRVLFIDMLKIVRADDYRIEFK